MNKPAIFLDRDDVLVAAVNTPDGQSRPPNYRYEMLLLPGVLRACEKLARRYPLIVVTNQAGVARGYVQQDEVEAMHVMLKKWLPLTAIYTCYHDTDDGCDCRKPKPGMLVQAALDLQIALTQSIMVGDRLTDVEAGRAAGCRTVRIGGPDPFADHSAPSLFDAVPWILKQGMDSHEACRPEG